MYELIATHCPLGTGLAIFYVSACHIFVMIRLEVFYNFPCDLFSSQWFILKVYYLIPKQLGFSSLPFILDFEVNSIVMTEYLLKSK